MAATDGSADQPPSRQDDTTDLLLRPAVAEDVQAIHDVFVLASAAEGHPPERRSPDRVRAWADGLVVPPLQSWVAEVAPKDEPIGASRVVGFVTLRGAWVTLLFVEPQHARSGIGSALLDLVKALRPQGFGLRVHQANRGARAFYRRHGLVELEATDGSAHHDAAADVQLAWLGEDPLAYLRGRIDEVDDELAVLLARRVALTAAVQDHKRAAGAEAGSRGRDEAREAEIVARMARHVPELDQAHLARVMHTVIAESLASWEERRGSG